MGRLLSGIPWIFGILLIVNSELAHGQRRTSRLTSTRTFGINAKSNPGSEFDCPEEFGYYPHPTDCSQYYVCVFGGALLESCTGGLMYSHELQTCDWPRNVGCEVVDGSSSQQQQQSIIPTQAAREVAPRIQQIQSQQQLQQQQPSLQQQPIQQSTIAPQRIRFSQPISTSAPQQLQQPSVQQPQPPSQRTLARQQSIQSIPQPEFPAPNPIITSRGQPKSYFDAQEDIAKLYAEAHDTLPPAEEEETDRQQRVYRGQPSTLGQVQRDRDGIIHHSNVNALPTHGKIGSFAFGSAITPYSTTQQPSNIFVQQPQRQKPVAEPQNTRNFYNTSNHQSYDSGSYDSFYSVYDDDVDLYRDVEYTNQQQSQQQQQQNQQQHQQQTPYNTQRGRPQPTAQSTYRPEIITTPTPQVPVRETYSNKQQSDVHQSHQQQQQQQSSGSYDQPSLTYNSEYDDALISQISDDQTYNNQPTRNPVRTRNRGGVHYTAGSGDRDPSSVPATVNRGTHPPRTRPTLKSKGSIVSKAAEFVDIYKNPPSRPEPLYPQPTPDKTAAKCRKDVCLLPDCSCGGKETPVGDMPFESIPQIVLLTFDDSVNDLNKQLYSDLFEKGRVNPNGCPITATFYVSHEWTDYSQVQNLYSDGHEIASHTVSHSFGEQFSQKKWTREIAGQREILSAYGGVKLSDVRGMRAPFLSIGGNKMFKMLYDSNFTYDSSMPVYENRPPSWPYTLDYKIFHDCMIPPCPTKSYPGVWEVPMVMWQDLNGGRCSMGDACANPPDSEGVTKMLMKNFDRHYTTNRAPFGLFYHAAWFTQPHHKEGFIKFLDTINAMDDVWIVTNWQALQWVRDPTPLSRIKQFQPFQCDYSDRPKRCNNPKVCNLWHKSGVRYMRTCQPCPDIYPWTGKTGIRSSRIDNEIDE